MTIVEICWKCLSKNASRGNSIRTLDEAPRKGECVACKRKTVVLLCKVPE